MKRKLSRLGFLLAGVGAFVVLTLLGFVIFAHADSLGDLRKKVLADKTVSLDIKAAIKKRIVINGMCPQQAFAAAGFPGLYMVQADKEKWATNVPPPVIIEAQCDAPDNSIIELSFRNSTQFGTNAVFRVRFEKGRAVVIDQNAFSSITSPGR
jgi:hypothetical protein